MFLVNRSKIKWCHDKHKDHNINKQWNHVIRHHQFIINKIHEYFKLQDQQKVSFHMKINRIKDIEMVMNNNNYIV